MKYWTKHQARANQTAESDQLNAELRASQSAITALDRTQTPNRAYDRTEVTQYALRQVWTTVDAGGNPMWGSGTTQGEQTNARSLTADTYSYQFLAVTYQLYNGGWRTAYTQTLNGFAGGHLHIEWGGQACVNLAFTQTYNNVYPANPKYMQFRIRIAGVTMVERKGVARSMDTFRVFGSGMYPQGDLQVEYQWKLTAAGQDDAIVSTPTGNHLMQGHIWGNKVMAIARYR